VIFGNNVRILCRLKVAGPGKTIIGNKCRIENDPWGMDYVTFYTHQKKARIIIGDNVLLRGTRFGSHLRITVEDHAVIESASIYDSDFHNIDARKRDIEYNDNDRAVVIKRNAYIGVECLCSKGTVVGDRAILLPVSVIGTKAIPVESKVCGFPAKVITIS
jgi:acetyltransferase-like isoleucine patch superfamily enzyme